MSTTITAADTARLDSFLAAVKVETDSVIAAETGLKTALDSARRDAKSAQDAVRERDRGEVGFDKPRFVALARIGAAYGAAYLANNSGPATGADAAAHSAASAFASAFTKAQNKTVQGGGVVAGFRAVINLGQNAERVRKALAERVSYWTRIYDEPKGESEDAQQYAKRRDDAARHMTPASCDGAKPKHAGRPGGAIHGIVLEPGKGTNRTSQLAAAAILYAAHGDNFLHPEVLDAFLDNGGKVEAPKDSLESAAGKAYDALIVVADEWKGRLSGDGALLSMALAVLAKARDTGAFTPAVAAHTVYQPPLQHVPAAPVAAEPAATLEGADSVDSVEPADTLTGADTLAGADTLLGDVVGDLLDKSAEELTGLATPPVVEPPPAPAKVRRGRGSMSPT